MDNYTVVIQKPSCVWANSEIIEDRIDSSYYRIQSLEDYNKICSYRTVQKIGKVCDVSKLSGFEYTDYFTQDNLKNGSIIALTSQNILENEIDFSNTIKIPSEIHEKLDRSKILPGDILLSYTGQYRRACVSPENTVLHLGPNICRIRKTKEIDEHFLSTFLNSKYGQSILDREKTMSAQPTVNMSRIREIDIPIPSPLIQKYIGDKIRKAELLRRESQKGKKEAEDILNGIYKLQEKSKKIFNWVNNKFLNADNIIPNFYKQYDLLNQLEYDYVVFDNVIQEIKCGIPVRSDMRIGNTYPFYGASGVTDSIGDYNFNGEYLIVAQDGSVGSVNVARGQFWANNHVWIVKLKDSWDLEFIELYLNKFEYWESLTTGSVVPKVTAENLKLLFVPKIDYTKQKEIGEKIRLAKVNEQVSKKLIEEAKTDVEALIEGTFDLTNLKAGD